MPPLVSLDINVTNSADMATAVQRYAAAYEPHYSTRNLPRSLRLYRQLLMSDPGTLESGYAQTQILNIANAVVPKDELLDASIKLALVHIGSASPVRIGTRQIATSVLPLSAVTPRR